MHYTRVYYWVSSSWANRIGLESLNMQFSSAFTREDTSSLPVPETKFKGSEGERLG